MLRAAMVFMILAGIFGLPAVMCSGCWSEIGRATGVDQIEKEGQALVDFLYSLSIIASIGSIITGALVARLKKFISGLLCFIFAICFALLLIQGNFFGLLSSLLLIISGVMIFVAPSEQFSAQTVKYEDVSVKSEKIKPSYQFCTKCGSKNESGNKFCSDCGEKY